MSHTKRTENFMILGEKSINEHKKNGNGSNNLNCHREPLFSTKQTLVGRKLDYVKTLSSENNVNNDLDEGDDTLRKIYGIHTVLGDIYQALNLPEPLAFALSWYGEFYMPMYGPLNAKSTFSATTGKIDILKEENEVVDRKIDDLKKIIESINKDDCSSKESKLKMIEEWIDSLATLKKDNDKNISSENQARLIYGGIGAIVGSSKTSTLILNSLGGFVKNDKISPLLGFTSYKILTKVLIPTGFAMAMASALKLGYEIYQPTTMRLNDKNSPLPKDIKDAIRDRINEKNTYKVANIATNIGFAALSTQTLHMTYGLYCIMGGLATLLGVGRLDYKNSTVYRSLSMKEHEKLRNNDELFSLFRHADKDLDNFKKSIEFYKKQPELTPIMYGLSTSVEKLKFCKERLQYLTLSNKDLEKEIGHSKNTLFNDFARKNIERQKVLIQYLSEEENKCKIDYMAYGKLKESMSIHTKMSIDEKNRALSDGFQVIVETMRKNDLEKDILNRIPQNVLGKFTEKVRRNRDFKIKYGEISNILCNTSEHYNESDTKMAKVFIKEFLKAASNSMQQKLLNGKINLRREIIDVITARNYVCTKKKDQELTNN